MKDVLFSIGPFTAHGYGMMIAIGLIAAYLCSEFRAKKQGKDADLVFEIAVRAAIGGLAGAKILYLIVEMKNLIKNPSLILQSLTSGWVVYGGIIGGILWNYFFFKKKKLNPLEWFDLILPQVALGQAFGRIGCLLAGCCYGVKTESAFHIVFTESGFAPNNVWLFPSQIVSSACNFVNFLLLVFVIGKFVKKPGAVAAFFLIFYSAGRFIIEFFRGDVARGSIGVLSTSQFISIFIFAGGIAFLLYTLKFRTVKQNNQ